MRRLLIIALFSFSVVAIQAQSTWAPIGAKWTYGIGYASSSDINYNEWSVIGDTLIESQTCSIIERSGQAVVGDISDKIFTYEESGVVYWRLTEAFSVLYDFNKNQGETYTMDLGNCDVVVTVDSTYTETINGMDLKVQYVSSDWPTYYSGVIMERVGHLSRPTPDILEVCVGNPVDMNYYSGLRCYEDFIFGSHVYTPDIGCDAVLVGIYETRNPFNLTLYPNPTNDVLNIKCDFTQTIDFSIYNSIGKKIKSGQLNADISTLNVNELKPGIYFLSMNDKVHRQQLGFIIEE